MRHAIKLKEPGIEEIMNDPIVEMLMERDGVGKDPLLALLREAAGSLTRQSDVVPFETVA